MYFLDKWIVECCGHANTVDSGRKAAVARPACGLTILGTDTDVGKTHVAQLLIRQLVARGKRVGAYKPVASGVNDLASDSDPSRLLAATGLSCEVTRVCPQWFQTPIAPPISARRQHRAVDEPLLTGGAGWWKDQCEVLIVEGAGGALSPLGDHTTVLDVATELGYPVVLVAAHRLGMMNHVLLTLEAIRNRGLQLLALVVNQAEASEPDSPVRLEESLACLLPFCNRILESSRSNDCGKIDCYALEYDGSTLSRWL